jgi:hypothetical protein
MPSTSATQATSVVGALADHLVAPQKAVTPPLRQA